MNHSLPAHRFPLPLWTFLCRLPEWELTYASHVFGLLFDSLGGSLLSAAISRTRTHKPRFIRVATCRTLSTGLQGDLKIHLQILLLWSTCVHYLYVHPSNSSLVQCDNCTSTDYNRILSLPIERIAHKEIHVVTAETCYIRHDYRRISFANAIMRIQPIRTVQLATGGWHARSAESSRFDAMRCDST